MARSRLSILSNASQDNIFLEPYPHLVVKNALDAPIFEQLQREYPNPPTILNGRPVQDRWFDYPACKVREDERITPLWKEFFAYHVSKDFFLDVIDLLGDQIRALNPGIEDKLGCRLEESGTSVRLPGAGDNPQNSKTDASMECQFYINYTRQPRAVRGPHVDRVTELYAGLLYFRDETDESVGSDLEICQAKDPAALFPANNRIRIARLPAEVRSADVDTVRTVKYEANTLAFFLNSPRSIHAVSLRTPTEVPRRHINFCADFFKAPEEGLFVYDLPLQKHLKLWLKKAPLAWRLASLIPD